MLFWFSFVEFLKFFIIIKILLFFVILLFIYLRFFVRMFFEDRDYIMLFLCFRMFGALFFKCKKFIKYVELEYNEYSNLYNIRMIRRFFLKFFLIIKCFYCRKLEKFGKV